MTALLKSARRFAQLLSDFLRLFFDFKRGYSTAPFLRVFGTPNHMGGPATKYGQLSEIVSSPRHPFSTVLCLSSIRVPVFLLWMLRARGAKILVNQNGVYYPRWFSGGWKSRNR